MSLLALCFARYRPDISIPEQILKPRNLPTVIQEQDSEVLLFWKTVVDAAHKGSRFVIVSPSQAYALKTAIKIIRDHAPRTHEAFTQFISHLVAFTDVRSRSFSHPHFFGCIFIDPTRPPLDLAVSIVHEMAHQELFLINLMDRLISKGSDYSLAHAPFQGKERPPIGRLHSAHALYRMIQFESNLIPEQVAIHQNQLAETVDSFRNDELTPFANSIIKTIYAQNSRLSTASTPLLCLPEVGLV